jgi:adenosylhomocysteine nucleosidase
MKPLVAIIAALPGELKPLIGRLQPTQSTTLDSFPVWRGSFAGKEIIAMQCGMGENNAAAAVTVLLRQRPDMLFSIGFAGAVRPGLAVGDLILATELFTYDGSAAMPVRADALVAPASFHAPHRYLGTILSTPHIVYKQAAAAILPQNLAAPVLDMETATIARAATHAGIPLVALRAITDDASMELAFSLTDFCDRSLRLCPWRGLATVVRKPQIIPQLIRLARYSHRAGKTLADGVMDLLRDHQTP